MLVVDDEQPIRVAASELLQRRGFEVVEAEDGIEALRRPPRGPEKFSAAIVDLMMPGMSGYKLIRELRKLVPTLPVVVALGMAGDLKAGEGSATLNSLGVRTVLTKPFTGDELCSTPLATSCAAP